ncbi:serine-rich adhesin for platelets [Hyalella azteca]|uniref:Serine-rich adhesin for platelets n=1 Tax=Hyalella azteca TaxID=294128 RepID=A0A8B7NZ49_HYAAZ|nr:serine-rich adhesin for platelets [Hyalella azteca]
MSSEKYNPTLESVEKDKQLPNAWSARIQMHDSSATASNYEEKNACVANLSDVATALHSLPSLLSRSALTEVESSSLPSGALSIVNTIGLTNENTLHKDQASSITDATNKSEEGQSSNLNVQCPHLQGPGAISKKIDFFPKINEPGNSDMTLKNDQIRIGSLVDGTQHNEDLSSIAGALPCTSNLIRFEAIPDPSSRPSENVLETADCPKALSTWQDITSNSACFEAPTSRFGASVKSSVMGSVNDMPKSTNMKTLPNCFSEAGLGLDQREDCLPIPSSNLGIQSFVGNSNPNESLSRLRAAKSIPTEQCSFLSPQPTLHGAQVLLPVGPNGVDSVQKARTEPCCEVAVASSTTSKIILTSNSISNISSAAGNISLAVSNAISAAINTITAASNTSSAAGNTSSAVSSSLSSFSPEQVVCKGDLGTEALRATRADSQNIAAHAAADGQHQPLKAAVFNAKAGPVYNWQATLTTVKDRFAFLFNNEILSDVQFVVGRGEEEQVIPAHKFVLAVGSAVFDIMYIMFN